MSVQHPNTYSTLTLCHVPTSQLATGEDWAARAQCQVGQRLFMLSTRDLISPYLTPPNQRSGSPVAATL